MKSSLFWTIVNLRTKGTYKKFWMFTRLLFWSAQIPLLCLTATKHSSLHRSETRHTWNGPSV